MDAPNHPLIASYADRHGLPAGSVRPDGRLTLVVDERYRIHMHAAPGGWLALSARLCDLPAPGMARDALLVNVGKMAAGMLEGHASTCTVDPREEALWLQQCLRPDAAATDLDEAVAQLANALSFWQGAVRRAA